MQTIEEYTQERDAILLMDNPAVFIDWATSKGWTFSNDIVAEITRKKLITACVKLPRELRDEARQWLEQRGYESWG